MSEKQEKREISYYHISMFDSFKSEYKRKKLNFKLDETSYTKKIIIDNKYRIFNSSGKPDSKTMILMNAVRNYARNYLDHLCLCDEEDELLRDTHISFYRLFAKPTVNKQIVKVDLKSAYWKYALRRGIVSEKTDQLFNKLYKNGDNLTAKKARLKALGGLATSHKLTDYIEGKPNYDTQEIKTEPTKSLYLEICRGVDELMQECRSEIEGVYYYYWDCVFVAKEFEQEAIDFFIRHGYNVNVDEDNIELVEHQGNSFIISTTNDKCYMIREEDKNLVTWLNKNNNCFNEDYSISEFH